MKLNKLTERNYKSIVDRGLISPTTNYKAFLDKFDEELKELKEAVDYIRTCKKNLYSNFEHVKEELADVILVGLNLAHHYGINIEEELIKKIEINEQRAENNTDSGDAKNDN